MRPKTATPIAALTFIVLSSFAQDQAVAQATGSGAATYQTVLSSAYPADGPGATAIVAKSGEVVFLGAAGMANLELGVPLSPGMVFEIGSITKQFTSVAIMMLAEEGKLSIDDPITEHLPEYPSYGDSVTIEHLLTHTSGIVSYTGIPGYMATEVRKDLSVEELVDVFDDLPVEFQPGERFAYNNSGYVLLGAIIEAASGMTYQEFIQQRIFEPLGMKSSYYGNLDRVIPNRAAGYTGSEDGYRNAPFLSMTQPYSAGALMSTVQDLYRWNVALHGGELLSPESYEQLITPYVLNDGSNTGYAYGLGIGDLRGRKVIRHGGGIFGYVTDALYMPEEGVFVAVFSNNTASEIGPGFVGTKLAAIAIGDPFPEWKAISLAESALKRFEGTYKINEDAERTIAVEDGQLFTQRTGGPKSPAYPSSETHFFYKTSFSHFEFVIEDGEVTGMLMYQGGSEEAEKAVKVTER